MIVIRMNNPILFLNKKFTEKYNTFYNLGEFNIYNY